MTERSPLIERPAQLPPTPLGETRFWCSCDVDKQNPFWSAADLLDHRKHERPFDQLGEAS